MNSIMKNRKGFTLVELLAVIVILAVLVLVALPAVTGLMTTAKMNAFKTEVLSIGQEFQTAYAAKSLTGTTSGTTYTDGLVHNTGSGNTYFCMSIKQLKDQNYIQKSDISNYGGYFQMSVSSATGATTVFVNVTNGAYYIKGNYNAVSSDSYTPDTVGGTAFAAIGSECPTTANVPTE